AEEVRAQFPRVDRFVSNVKKIFLKAPSRGELFKAMLDIPLPPKPVLTRWGTWIEAALYYAIYIADISSFIENELCEDDVASIRLARDLCDTPSVRDDLAMISAHFDKLPRTITQLEGRGVDIRS